MIDYHLNGKGIMATVAGRRAIFNIVIRASAGLRFGDDMVRPWEPIWSAPIEQRLEGWVRHRDGTQGPLPFPIKFTRVTTGHSEHGHLVDARTGKMLDVCTSHWRFWRGPITKAELVDHVREVEDGRQA